MACVKCRFLHACSSLTSLTVEVCGAAWDTRITARHRIWDKSMRPSPISITGRPRTGRPRTRAGVPGRGVPGCGVPGCGVPGRGVPGHGVPGHGVPRCPAPVLEQRKSRCVTLRKLGTVGILRRLQSNPRHCVPLTAPRRTQPTPHWSSLKYAAVTLRRRPCTASRALRA